MIVRWDDLPPDEKEALERLFTHDSVPLLPALADRLISQGLAAQKLGGVSITQAGEELVVQHSGRR